MVAIFTRYSCPYPHIISVLYIQPLDWAIGQIQLLQNLLTFTANHDGDIALANLHAVTPSKARSKTLASFASASTLPLSR